MRRIWIFIFLAAGCAILAAFFSVGYMGDGKILIVQDPLDSITDILKPISEEKIEHYNAYMLGHRLAGLNGMTFVFGPQARNLQKQYSYEPLSSVTAVIAVNKKGNSAGKIKGWRTLLESDAVVLTTAPSIEDGRLKAIALAQGLQAAEGDITPALEAFSYLQSHDRLNHQDEYKSLEYRNMVPLENMLKYDAILLWDYQAAKLIRIHKDWEIVMPEEGALSVDWGILSSLSIQGYKDILAMKDYLLSQEGRQALMAAGYMPYTSEKDLSLWDEARFEYNPRFRRTVLSVKLYSPASVQERLFLQCITLLLFCLAAQQILRRIPRGIRYKTSLSSMILVALWLLIGIGKTLALYPDLARYCWFSTYIPRHFFPICWLCMCYANRYNRLPTRKAITILGTTSLLLTVLVFTNDLHQLVFAYKDSNPWSWTQNYANEPLYYLSVFWSFSIGIAGLILFINKGGTRRQKRQLFYAMGFFIILLIYQLLYVYGVKYIIDLDIPTTIAISVLVFNLLAQRERFMGAFLLGLPIFYNSPYAIAVYDSYGKTVYSNTAMDLLRDEGVEIPKDKLAFESGEFYYEKQVFKPYLYALDNGKALVLEDVTYLKGLEKSLQGTHDKLKSVQKFLIRNAEDTRNITGKLEQERYSMQMEQLFKEKVENVRQQLQVISKTGDMENQMHLRRLRFLLCICQQRLGFIIRSLVIYPSLPGELIERYVKRIMKDGRRFGLDGVFTAAPGSYCPSSMVAVLLEFIDSILLYAFDSRDLSLICHMNADNREISFSAIFSWEGIDIYEESSILAADLIFDIETIGGRINEKKEKDSLLLRLLLPGEEGRK